MLWLNVARSFNIHHVKGLSGASFLLGRGLCLLAHIPALTCMLGTGWERSGVQHKMHTGENVWNGSTLSSALLGAALGEQAPAEWAELAGGHAAQPLE